MLTRELLQANTALAGLNEEQLTAIETLSKNDENTVIGKRIGEVYREMDNTIAKATGIERNGDEKTYFYLERAAKQIADNHNDLSKQVAELTKEKTRLEKVIAEGNGDNETKKALAQAQKDVASITKDYTELKSKFDAEKAEYDKKVFDVELKYELNAATAGLKLKKDLPEAVTRVIVSNAIDKIKAMNPEFIDNGEGGKQLAFKGDDGAIMRNRENQLKPFTASEMIANELKSMGVLDEGRQQSGGGTNTPTGNQKTGSLDVAGAKSQTEAYEMITNSLLAQGLTIGSDAFENAKMQAWKDNNIDKLPMQ
jgi:hypothetical protein